MRIWPDHVRMNKPRSLAGPAIGYGARKCRIRRHRIGAVDFLKMEIRETGDQTRDVSPRSLNFDRN